MEKSRQVENELRSIKETVTDLDRVFSEEKMKKNVSNPETKGRERTMLMRFDCVCVCV